MQEVIVIGYSTAEGLRKHLSPTCGLAQSIVKLLEEESAAEVMDYRESAEYAQVGWENSHYEQARVQQRRKALHKFHEQKRKKAKQCKRKR